jgi:hypothetical protein
MLKDGCSSFLPVYYRFMRATAINATFRTFAQSLAGSVRFKRYLGAAAVANPNYSAGAIKPSRTRSVKSASLEIDKSTYMGSIASVVKTQVAQLFQRVHCPGGLADAEDAKFDYFCQHVLSPLHRHTQSRVLIYCPSYFQFVRVRNEMMRREVR